MRIKETTNKVRLAQWAKIMRERNESGQSIRSWCIEKGINEKTYYYWQRRLREAACEQITGLKAQKQRVLDTSKFAEVKLALPDNHKTSPKRGRRSQLHIEVEGVKISADSSYPSEKLAELCRELAKPC